MAKQLAKASNYDGAIQQLKQCITLMEQANDKIGAANVHLMIVDMEKLKAKAAAASTTREASRPPVIGKSTAPPTGPASRPVPTGPEDPMAVWEEGKRLLANGEQFAALQKFMSARRGVAKLGRPDLLKELEGDIAKAKGGEVEDSEGFQPVASIASNVPSTDAGGGRTPQQLFSQAQPVEMYPTFQKALAAKERGDYVAALDGLAKCYELAVGPEKREIEKQLRRVEQLAAMKEKVTSSASPGGFTTVGMDGDAHPAAAAASPDASSPYAGQVATAGFRKPGEDLPKDIEDRAKLQKRREAEQLIVEAENTEDSLLAIEKLKDAAHLFLVTGSRLDRVEWIYDKINQIRQSAGVQKVGLFEVEKFPPGLLRDYAFQCIDDAKEKARYGKYKDAVNFYTRSVKALNKASWTQEQIGYIINDMIAVRKEQDRVELEEERLQATIDEEMHYLLDRVDTWREGKYIGFAPATASFDQDIHMPGREKTVEEKNYEKVMAIQAERRRLRLEMDTCLEDARHASTMGRFQDAIDLYNKAIKNMDLLGGWDSQKGMLLAEIDNLKQLHRRQQEILHEQKAAAASGSASQKADVEEKFFLIKKAALLNQENIKETLLMKRARDEMERTVFEILMPAANKLKEEGKIADALVEFKEALKLLTEAGWTSQTQSLRDEIADLEASVQNKTGIKTTAKERQAIRKEVFDDIIPKARKATIDGQHRDAKRLYQSAVEKLRSIGWEEYVRPILDNIAEIEAAVKKEQAREASITDQDRKYISKEHIEMGMRFMAKGMAKYALVEFQKAIELLDRLGDNETREEVARQVKKLELEIKLEESQKLLLERKRGV
ncbi:MAG: hypothetical protein JW839_23060 [Candidatus Lokiarchaeota archaeon]|nr:hypothetical protein [Candidatus Lokiarchaeota archaeon]